ncbi:D-alanyl-D-alanine carboxypeptidase family protein [Bittarella massiliensis (ex Durand et al. 2017)]|uniref:D-alanyl-D-alanine carboxypeptidase family protein n=1 Tax=Bittarella massiliensis (ex Durand et al. 2017) TaxID=1720313 RepID=UPI001AA0CC81|nr:D-alanyl-D-alanine carboxypeptidase family protein [Bittarella massiliensis (ex Durand et al. 2017)]MBO1678451.1 D-alanyl-D-alanine carboxypeptidase [Bittarella massiliensis (ex Durand et al. 2017)]
MKKLAAALVSAALLLSASSAFAYEDVTTTDFDLLGEGGEQPVVAASPAPEGAIGINAKSAILLEQSTGQVLYEQSADEPMPPASITKIMTLLLVMEAIDAGKFGYDDMVSASDYACKMGGSQIWLEPGEQMSVNDLIKATAISSANDAAAALGEYVAGSPEAFVALMNQRAQELGMQNTHFENPNGLDAAGHVSTARDIAIMSCELLKHPDIKKYSTVWMDSLRGGATQLVNTNKLVRFYDGCVGLKTGTTDGAGSCLSAAAERGGLSLVAVVMGCPTSNDRFNGAKALLDYGFANYEMAALQLPETAPTTLQVKGGVTGEVPLRYGSDGTFLVKKGSGAKIVQAVQIAEEVTAPVEEGQKLGIVELSLDGEKIGEYPVTAGASVAKMDFLTGYQILLKYLFVMR